MDQKSQNIMGSKNVKLIWVQKCQFNMGLKNVKFIWVQKCQVNISDIFM